MGFQRFILKLIANQWMDFTSDLFSDKEDQFEGHDGLHLLNIFHSKARRHIMPGSAGSKYGIVEDDIPLKTDSDTKDNLIISDSTKTQLKQVRPILRILKHRSKASNKRAG